MHHIHPHSPALQRLERNQAPRVIPDPNSRFLLPAPVSLLENDERRLPSEETVA
jgi:hypothetical protein